MKILDRLRSDQSSRDRIALAGHSLNPRRLADAAERSVRRRQERLRETLHPFVAFYHRHAIALPLGSGFAAGVIAGLLRIPPVARVWSFANDTTRFLLNSQIGTLLTGMALTAVADRRDEPVRSNNSQASDSPAQGDVSPTT